MPFTDSHRKTLSFCISVFLHAVILLIIPLFSSKEKSHDSIYSAPPVPITLTVKEILPEPDPIPDAPIIPVAPKPTSLPGDRPQAHAFQTPEPYYPKDAINMGYEGKVGIRASISASGQVEAVELIDSSGYSILDEAFIFTVKEYYEFKPKRIMGVDQKDKLTLYYEFSL